MLVIALGAAAALACGTPDLARAEECERILRHGQVSSTEKLAEGVTASSRLELRDGTRTLRATFKTVDSRSDVAYRFGSETVKVFRDSWKHEVAAYELDKRLGLGLVPPTVARKVQGKEGSVQAWVERTLARFVPGPPPPDPARAEDQMHALRMFDYLIFDTDRHVRNVLFGRDWNPVAIDHSIGFAAFRRPFRALYRFPRGPLEKLRGLEAPELRRILGRYLARDEIDGLVARRALLLERAEAAGPGALFDR
jgi:hypothetical protein